MGLPSILIFSLFQKQPMVSHHTYLTRLGIDEFHEFHSSWKPRAVTNDILTPPSNSKSCSFLCVQLRLSLPIHSVGGHLHSTQNLEHFWALARPSSSSGEKTQDKQGHCNFSRAEK